MTLTGMVKTAVVALACATAQAQTVPSGTRGELLYGTHCLTCHNENMHWRDKRQATNWESLKAEVRRWQATASLQWTEADITAVAHYLNDTIYHHPQSSDRVATGVGAHPVATSVHRPPT